jgi:hypothetical protein
MNASVINHDQADRNSLAARLDWIAMGLYFNARDLWEAAEEYGHELDAADLHVLRAFETGRCDRNPRTAHRYSIGLQEVARKIRAGTGSTVVVTIN